MPSLEKRVLQQAITSTVRLRFALDSLFFRNDPSTLSLLDSLKARIAGKPLLVVGNGPSLKQTPLDEFAGIPAIGMNKIDLIYPSVAWRPTLIICVNNLVVRQHRDSFRASAIPVFLASKCRWFQGRNGNGNIHYFRNRPTAEFSTDIRSGLGSISPTVTYSALQFAYYLHADPVILVGVDHRFDTDPTQSGIEKRLEPDGNHFSPNYFRPGQYWGLPDLGGSEASYERARIAFEAAGRAVLDATVDGALMVFPKISISQALDFAKAEHA